MKKALAAFWKQTAEAMSGKPSIDGMNDIITQIAQRLGEIDKRLPAIRHDGIERRQVIESGSPDDLIQLDQELKELQAEETQLRYRSGELHKRKRLAQAEEGINNAARNRKDLAGLVEEAVRAERAYLKARGQAMDIVEKVTSARINAREEGLDNSECWLETEDLTRLAKMLYPDDTHQAQEKRFDWSRDKVKSIDDAKIVALGGDSHAVKGVQLKRMMTATGGYR